MAGDLRAWLGSLSQRVISEHDSEQERLNKTLLIFASGLMAFAAMVWVAIYQAMGIRFSSTVPFTYVVLSAAALALDLWKGNFPLFRFIQTSLFLFVPFIMQWSIGSYISSSGVMLWALLAPVGVMIFQGPRESLPWFFAYIVLTALSAFFDYYLTEGVEAGVTMQSIAVFFALNFAGMSTIVYLLISYFVRQRDRAGQDVEQQPLGLLLLFLQLLVLRGGILDGRAGVVVCGLAAWYTFLKDAKLWALRNCRVSANESATAAHMTNHRRPTGSRAAA